MAASQVQVVELHVSDLAELRARVKPDLPRSSGICISALNVIEGRVEGNFYTDGWPNFTTVVFQCLKPRLSEICDLHCCTTCKQRLLSVLEQAGLVTAGRWQYLQVVEDGCNKDVTDFLIQHLRLHGKPLTANDYSLQENVMCALEAHHPATFTECPQGYRIKRLSVEHSKHVLSQLQASQWNTFGSIDRPSSVVEEYNKHCFEWLDSSAAFHNSDPTVPVSWQSTHAFSGEIGNLFTLKDHRRKGLASATKSAVCKNIVARGEVPFSTVMVDNSSNIELHYKLGFRYFGRLTELYLHSSIL